MLGTVYAANDAGDVKYFDYDWDGARAFAGVSEDRDPRVFCAAERSINISKGQVVLYLLR